MEPAAQNPGSRQRILLVEDDPRFGALLRDLLQSEGYQVSLCVTGVEAVERILGETPDLVVLDVMLPGLDGIAVCRRVRAWYQGAIIMLTALAEESDQLAGLGVGADDYLVKTSAGRLLCARIHAHLRRQDRLLDPDAVASDRIDLGWLVIDAANREAQMRGERLVLSSGEFDLLNFLARRAGRVVSRDDIAQEFDGAAACDAGDRSVDLRMSRLRRKLGPPDLARQRLKSVRGAGYLLVRHDPVVDQ